MRRRGQSGLTLNPHASRTAVGGVDTLAYLGNRRLS
ncbi:hypothetical protein SBA3_4770009 [Candidatus Sulfopaludibacter sp. SbA3]|nr:hypothetical protein SBA3_4770009 [Candidatus Sulfopaludibacter sp. SbA3]